MKKLDRTAGDFIFEYQLSSTAQGTANDLMATLMAYYGFSVAVSNALTNAVGILGILNLLGGILYLKAKRPRLFLRIFCTSWRVFLPCIFLSVLLPVKIGAAVMAAAYLLTNAAYQFQTSSQLSWMTGTLEGRVGGSYYLWRSTIWLVTYTVVSLLAGLAVDKAQLAGTSNRCFPAIGMVFTVFVAASVFFLFRLPAPKTQTDTEEKVSVLEMFRRILTGRKCRWVLGISMLWSFASPFVIGFSALYKIQVLQVSLFEVTLWATVGYALRSLSAPLVSRLSQKIGWVRVTAAGFGLVGLTAGLWFVINAGNMAFLFPIAAMLTVMPHTVFDVGFLQMDIAAVPQTERSIYFSVKSLLNWGVSILAALASTALIHSLEIISASALKNVFLVGAGGMVLCVLVTLLSEKRLKTA